MINGFMWILDDSSGYDGASAKRMKYQGEKKGLFKEPGLYFQTRLFSLALQFCRSPVLLVYIDCIVAKPFMIGRDHTHRDIYIYYIHQQDAEMSHVENHHDEQSTCV